MIRKFTKQKIWLRKVKIAGSSACKNKKIKMMKYKHFLTKVAKCYEVWTSLWVGEEMILIF